MMTPMLFSVSYAGLWGQHYLDLNTFIEKAGKLGYSSIELMGKRPHLSVLDTDDAALEQLKETAKNSGVKIGTIAGYNDFSGSHAGEVPFVEMQLSYISRLGDMAEKLGADLVRIFTGYTTDEEAYRADWDSCISAVKEASSLLQDKGIKLGLQNHHDTGVAFESFREFLDDVAHENCFAMFDPWSPALHGDDLYECAKEMAPRMIQTTLADYIKLRRFSYMPGLVNYKKLTDMVRAVPVGEGFIDQEAFFKGLQDGGFDGYVAYEMCSPLRGGGSEENLDMTAKKSLVKIESLIS